MKQTQTASMRQFVVVLGTDEEAGACLLDVARAHSIVGAEFAGLGALWDVTLGFFDTTREDYDRIHLDEQVEVVSLVGNFATEDGAARLHPHVVVSRRDGTAWGGHLLEAHVRPTLEVIVTELPEELQRRADPETGLPLLSI
ncbi:PPC domain-containing DNA-binding protein [Jannaschia seosinensis]|uniref:PPC domain-containing DNA-binding protein n=1 Tax=Jannaschia seosinensis TaxID=313367 RepID=UPI001C9196BF|nr:PPC domain-containing DNA-binding protein [Jannaschia seosinensis]